MGFCGFALIIVASLGIEKDFQNDYKNIVFYFYLFLLFNFRRNSKFHVKIVYINLYILFKIGLQEYKTEV